MSKIRQVLSKFLENKWFKILMLYNNTININIKRARFKSAIKNNQPPHNYLSYYTDSERSVEIKESDNEIKRAIISSYFVKKADPQLGIVRSNADINYIKPWYYSIIRLQLNGIILHDGLDQQFIDTYENQYVKFRKVESGNYSIFEERWFAYYQFLASTNIEWVFFTDINDVFITQNPFAFAKKKDVLYIGRDNANKIRKSKWLFDELIQFEKDSGFKAPQSYILQHVYNAGVVGGAREIMLFFTSKIIEYTMKTQSNYHKDMTLVNLVIHEFFPHKLIYSADETTIVKQEHDEAVCSENIFSGYPLNSAFKKYESDSNAIFIHK